MNAPIFISYRREDSSAEAGRLYTMLLEKLGDQSVFMDTSSIRLGTNWPDKIQSAAEEAETVLAIIGPEWLRASNEWGERRIDQENDWVRQEIQVALQKNKTIIPVLVQGATMPPVDKLPSSISELTIKQAVEVRRDYWDHDIQLVVRQFEDSTNHVGPIEEYMGVYPVPPPEIPDPISEEKLKIALEGKLSNWKVVKSTLPEERNQHRVELFREFKFESFSCAISFMNEVAPGCDIALHHPRWENIYKTVRVYLTTFDIGHRISDRDIQLAKYFDHAYLDFPGAIKRQ